MVRKRMKPLFAPIFAALIFMCCIAAVACTQSVTIVFDTGVEGVTAPPPITLAAGSEITEPDKPIREGWRFDGWADEKGNDFVFDVMPQTDITLKAKWTKVYGISFDTGAADFSVDTITEPAGTEISPPTVNRPGYHLVKWKLGNEDYKFSSMPEKDITLTAEWMKLTNLPSMFIELTDKNGNAFPLGSVDKETYITSKISLENTREEFLMHDVAAGFRGRGNGSWNEAKKGYKIKFDKKQSLFGRAANKHWVIIACANFNDPTMSRNYLAYNMAGEVFSAIEFSTLAEWVDVYVNGSYHGMYLLCEHTRVGDGRVDIKSEYGKEDTGYLIEYDSYCGGEEGVDYFRVDGVKYGFSMHSPDPEDYAEEGITKDAYKKQVAYIKNYVDRVYKAALSGDYETFASLADVDSFVDMYILHELFKNVDTGWSSFYLYKKPGGKLYAGPPWDFDATTNISERGDRSPQGIYVAGSIQTGSPGQASELYISLYKTAGFKNAVKTRWQTLSPKISAFIEGRMNDTVYQTNRAAMGKNFAKWYNKSQSNAETDWIIAMKTLKNWFVERIAWLNTEWKI